MTEQTPDRWTAGDAYEAYMGRWSRAVARAFLEWLRPRPSSHWLEVGCGTGALSSAICDRCQPASLVACDPSESFIQHAQSSLLDTCASFVIAGADTLPRRAGSFDAVVSGLVLNFLHDPGQAVVSMRERLRSGGLVAAYVWDYAQGMAFLQYFWEEAVALDSSAIHLSEGYRFRFWQPFALASLFRTAGLINVETDILKISMDFVDFADYWKPFLGGSGPAPTYVATLEPTRREQLRARLERRLAADDDGHIRLQADAMVVRGVAM